MEPAHPQMRHGGMFMAETPNMEAYGIYAAQIDTGGGKAWAGYFDEGDVFIANNVGIGTTSTSTYALNINGSLNTTSLYLAGSQVSATATELNLLSGRSGTLLIQTMYRHNFQPGSKQQ
ncbi:hypothetical protein IPM65_03405 [Candidatus Roizmanbacteria bacterium]|nr:MAG: hypothetical protein IPM65_03405 [Candidatus Roizmanbacteria bacterium]